jgi:hypothetical protein
MPAAHKRARESCLLKQSFYSHAFCGTENLLYAPSLSPSKRATILFQVLGLRPDKSRRSTEYRLENHQLNQDTQQTCIMAGSFHFQGKLPNVDVIGICRAVFNELLRNPAAVSDLSLPPPEATSKSFDELLSKINFCFHRVSGNTSISYTDVDILGKSAWIVSPHIFYTKQETATPEIIQARVLHEATHAFQYAIVHFCDNSVDANRRCTPTPDKPRMEMQFDKARGEVPLYKLENPHFHSGYWMEHVLLGGVWATLYGYILDADDKMVTLPPEGMLFKLERRLERKIVEAQRCCCEFTELEGCGRNCIKTRIYHYGHRITGHQEDEWCVGHD